MLIQKINLIVIVKEKKKEENITSGTPGVAGQTLE